jgi:hypothetical protein
LRRVLRKQSGGIISSLISIVTPPSQPDPSDHADHLAVGQ